MLRSSQVVLWWARRREAELSEMGKDASPVLGRAEGEERGRAGWGGFLVWMESLALESHIKPIIQEGAFSQASLIAQVICAAEFQIFSNFPALLQLQVVEDMQERDQCDSFIRTSHLSLAAAGFWVKSLVFHHLRKLISYLWSVLAMDSDSTEKAVPINRHHFSSGQGVLQRAEWTPCARRMNCWPNFCITTVLCTNLIIPHKPHRHVCQFR